MATLTIQADLLAPSDLGLEAVVLGTGRTLPSILARQVAEADEVVLVGVYRAQPGVLATLLGFCAAGVDELRITRTKKEARQ